MVLNFSTFYYSAVKDNCPLRQYDIVNLLFCGAYRQDVEIGEDISEAAASSYVNGTKAISKRFLLDLIQCDQEEIVRRVRLLSFYDVSQVVSTLLRLLDAVTLSSSTKNELLRAAKDLSNPYPFIASVFLQAIKCPYDKAQKLTAEEKQTLMSFRTGALGAKKSPSTNIPKENPSQDIHSPGSAKDNGKQIPPQKGFTYSPKTKPDTSAYPVDFLRSPETIQIKYRPVVYIDDCDSVLAHFAPFLSDYPCIIQIDEADIYSVLTPGKNYRFVLMEISGQQDPMKNSLLQMQNLAKCDSMVFALEMNQTAMIENIDVLLHAASSTIDLDANIIVAVSINDTFSEDFYRLHLLFRFNDGLPV